MNTITIASIKSGGMNALNAALLNGPATIMKRNRAAAVVLTQQAYEALLHKANPQQPSASALDWLLQAPPRAGQGLAADAMAQRLSEASSGWAER
jgi:PHD/YefM family antitoxin component YafN of YafNO toxin-antitoxin module